MSNNILDIKKIS